MQPNSEMFVIKKNIHGQVTWRYNGQMVECAANYIVLEAFFDRQDMDLHGLFLGKGDRFIETWYTDRWYNIFEIHAREDDHLRGWYCNIGCPAEIDGYTISYIDLSLDLLVFPDGRQVVLDEDEFTALELSPEMRQQALEALLALKTHFHNKLERPC
jgi:predicted RNA-binding protein associated with RNAse of E/G family